MRLSAAGGKNRATAGRFPEEANAGDLPDCRRDFLVDPFFSIALFGTGCNAPERVSSFPGRILPSVYGRVTDKAIRSHNFRDPAGSRKLLPGKVRLLAAPPFPTGNTPLPKNPPRKNLRFGFASLTISRQSAILIRNRGVAQLVAREVWEHAGGGDAPAGKRVLRAKSKIPKVLANIEETAL